MKKRRSPKALPPEVDIPQRIKRPWWLVTGILLFVFCALLAVKKGLVVSALVNGRPIFSWQLSRSLHTQFGQQVLENMIAESLVRSQAAKEKVSVTTDEVEVKTQEILASLGENVNFDDFLKYQGMTKQNFTDQIRMQLTVSKLLEKTIVITDGDIDLYIASNRAMLRATDPAELRKEAHGALLSEKISQNVQSWFADIKEKAKILKFL
ncbi:SurA N-terminal domain-containing protein [Patescibacteria group bacterium]|nr:SurA N-terminal domain-containing protein [Patescibacteria group bacterium]MBU1472856.1 SurA N-terminal domain-containing protein [Patescibacteria group bacterium]MBU2459513.1 SurA N-terminal domain-containing protein [Patescibacteria group bacterium]MBU2543962.1 SurA N-terminal domain-containing protein [Patescibacteria group bacterium]